MALTRRLFIMPLALLAMIPHAGAATLDVGAFGAIPNDGIDDSAAINNAINSAAPGDTISIPAGVFNISNKIVTKSNTTLTGVDAASTTLRWSGTAAVPLLALQNVSNVNVGNFTLDGNNSKSPTQGIYATTSSNLDLHDLAVKNLAITTGFSPHGIYFDTNVNSSIIQNNTLINLGPASQWGAGIRLGHGSSFNQVLSNTIAGTGRGGILCDDNSTDLTIKNNTVTGSGGEGLGIELQGGCDRAVVEDNHVDHWISVDSSNGLAVRRNVISDTSGVYKYTGLELVDAHDDIFTDNIVNGGQQLGISVSGPDPKTRIFWAHNTIKSASTWGVQIQGESGKATEQYFYKNSFQFTLKNDPNTLYAPQGHGVRFNGNANHIIFDANLIDSNQGAGVQLIGGNLSDLTFKNNTITNNAGAAFTSSGVTNLVWTNNIVSGNGNNTQPSSSAPANSIATSAAMEQVEVGQPVQFSFDQVLPSGSSQAAATAGYANVLWDFGDGVPSTDFYPTHVFMMPGIYYVSMLGWDAAGNGVLNQATVSVVPESAVGAGLAMCAGLMSRRRGVRSRRKCI